ncbi:MAG: ExbD/TolR family protein [Pseudohongiellaceae bacterium]|jgi:biopolymer transport protein ExbD
MRMRRHNSDSHDSSHGIDLAPMLDFVLNLLIFFIITAIFVKEFGLSVNRPTELQQSNSEGSSIQIQITDAGDIFVDNRVVDVRAVRANVERLKAINPETGVLIIADDAAKTGVIMGVVDQVRLGGIFNITFSTSG